MKRAMLLAAVFAPVVLGAQIPEILPGSRLKVTTATSTVTGTLMSQAPDTLIIAENRSVHRRLATGDIQQILVARALRSNGAGAMAGLKRGALIGGAIGAASGGSLGEGVEGLAGGAVFGAVFGALCGTVIGFLIGAESWQRIY